MPNGFTALPTVELRPDERDEAQRFLRSLASDGQQIAVRNEIAEDFKRCMIAWSLVGRAERFSILRDWPSACAGAAKACSVYPCPIYFYDFARILRNAGKPSKARTMFGEFLRRMSEPLGEVDELVLGQRDVESAIAGARQAMTERQKPWWKFW